MTRESVRRLRAARRALLAVGLGLIVAGAIVSQLFSVRTYRADAVPTESLGPAARQLAVTAATGPPDNELEIAQLGPRGVDGLSLAGRFTSPDAFAEAANAQVSQVNQRYADQWATLVSNRIGGLAAERGAVIAQAETATVELGAFAASLVPLDPPPTLNEVDPDITRVAAESGRSVFDTTALVVQASRAGARVPLIDADIAELSSAPAPAFELGNVVEQPSSRATPLAAQALVMVGAIAVVLAALLYLRRTRRLKRLAALIFLGVIVGWVALTAYELFRAAGDGRRIGELAESLRNTEDVEVEQLQADLGEITDSASAASRRVNRPWVQALRFVPVVGSQFEASTQFIDLAADASRSGRLLVDRAAGLTDRLADDSVGITGAAAELSQPVEVAADDFETLVDFDLDRLPSVFDDRLSDVETQLVDAEVQIDRTQALLGFLAALDGQQFLIIGGNSGDSRAGMGAFLQFGTVSSDSTGLVIGELSGIGDGAGKVPFAPPNPTTLPPELAVHTDWLNPTSVWQSLGLSYDFAPNAQMAARMWEALGNEPVAGVLYLDPVALSYIAEVTGPIAFEQDLFDFQDLIGELLEGQYELEEGQEVTGLGRYARQERAAALSQAVVDRALDMQAAEPGQLLDLASALSQAADERHAMIWSADPALQQQLVAGSLAGHDDGQTLQLWLGQLSGKWDDYTDIDTAVSVTCGDVAQVTVDVTVTFNGGPGRSPEFDWAPGWWGEGQGTLVALAGVNLPATATNITGSIGQHPLSSGRVAGSHLDLSLLRVGAASQHFATVSFDMPADAALSLGPSGRLGRTTWRLSDQPITTEPINAVRRADLRLCGA